MMRKAIIAATWVVWLHVLVAILHAVAHIGAHILPASFFDYAFIVVVIMIAPVVALFLLNNAPTCSINSLMILSCFALRLIKGHSTRLGALLLFFSMLGALLYGLLNHFLLPGADNATHMLPGVWQLPFLVTSYLLLILEAAGSVIGAWGLFVREDYKISMH
jgi:hypothetical protein